VVLFYDENAKERQEIINVIPCEIVSVTTIEQNFHEKLGHSFLLHEKDVVAHFIEILEGKSEGVRKLQ